MYKYVERGEVEPLVVYGVVVVLEGGEGHQAPHYTLTHHHQQTAKIPNSFHTIYYKYNTDIVLMSNSMLIEYFLLEINSFYIFSKQKNTKKA